MLDNAQTTAAVQADIDALRERFPRTTDLYLEACTVMFFRHGITPTANSLYQLVRKGSMSVPTQALRDFWSDLRKRARVDLQHVDMPDQIKESGGRLIGEIWAIAREAADASLSAMRQDALAELEEARADNARLKDQAAQLSASLSHTKVQVAAVEAIMGTLQEELSTSRANQLEESSKLTDAYANLQRVRDQVDTMAKVHAEELNMVTGRIVQAEHRYADLEKRMLMEVDRERTAAVKLQKQFDAERRAAASRIEEMQAQVLEAQFRLARQGQELGSFVTKAELLAEERDRAVSYAEKSGSLRAAQESELAAERAKVAELRRQLEAAYMPSKSISRKSRQDPAAPGQRRRVRGKPGDVN